MRMCLEHRCLIASPNHVRSLSSFALRVLNGLSIPAKEAFCSNRSSPRRADWRSVYCREAVKAAALNEGHESKVLASRRPYPIPHSGFSCRGTGMSE